MSSTECCVCGQPVSTEEDGGDGCQLVSGKWVCSSECWEKVAGDDVGQIVFPGDTFYGEENDVRV